VIGIEQTLNSKSEAKKVRQQTVDNPVNYSSCDDDWLISTASILGKVTIGQTLETSVNICSDDVL
jgi:hypothetical protein